jgi:hypothetical protein
MLKLEKVICRLGKISNNLEKHGDEDVTEFNIPISGVLLTAKQLNDFMDDPHCDRAWFNTKGSLKEPMPWWQRGEFSVSESLEAEACTIIVSGDQEIEFEAEGKLPGCKISRITLAPQVGGMTEVCFQLQVRPGIGRENLLLQEHQNREVRLTIAKSRVALKRGKQQNLALDDDPEGGGEEGNGGKPPAKPAKRRGARPEAH